MCVPRIKEPIVLPPESIIEAREKARKKGTCRMKPSFDLRCPYCGSNAFGLKHEADSTNYCLVCDTCVMSIATIPTYSIKFTEEEEETNADTK